ncbi:hypothetical protein ACQPZF_11415 [Actinosynnema sp. CS-041913]|uniref:hypothetical protein n=1 Tax=Actinosynnema sp. CS-041913 TaxID=3239917 RepID=UPI003D92E1FF
MVNEEFLAEMAKLQHYAAGLQGLVADAQAKAPPRVEGRDRTGSVHVVLDRDGLPDSVRVEFDWNRRLEPGAFGSAVLEAAQAAMGTRMAEWTRTLQSEGWQERADRLQAESEQAPRRPVSDELPPALRRKVAETEPRPIGELAEELIKAFDGIEQQQLRPPTPAGGVGEVAAGKLRLTLTGSGLASCDADPDWVRDQTAARLMNALNEALALAKARLASVAQQQEPSTGLDRLFTEALSILGDPHRLADS